MDSRNVERHIFGSEDQAAVVRCDAIEQRFVRLGTATASRFRSLGWHGEALHCRASRIRQEPATLRADESFESTHFALQLAHQCLQADIPQLLNAPAEGVRESAIITKDSCLSSFGVEAAPEILCHCSIVSLKCADVMDLVRYPCKCR